MTFTVGEPLTTAEYIERCPTPQYHETHRYCPTCPWTERWNGSEFAITHELELYYDNIVAAWVISCSCGQLGKDNYGALIENVGRAADAHLVAARV